MGKVWCLHNRTYAIISNQMSKEAHTAENSKRTLLTVKASLGKKGYSFQKSCQISPLFCFSSVFPLSSGGGFSLLCSSRNCI